MSQVGQRRGKTGVKGAKNSHLLMKGKITHLALVAWLPAVKQRFSLALSECVCYAGLHRGTIHSCGEPHSHFLRTGSGVWAEVDWVSREPKPECW